MMYYIDLARGLTVGIEPTTCYLSNPHARVFHSQDNGNHPRRSAQFGPNRDRTAPATGNEVATARGGFDAGAGIRPLFCHGGAS